MSKLVKITIDGKEVEVPEGLNLIEAAKRVGIEIPHYCYHPDLSVPGNCRMCQCKVEGSRKMDIACNTQVREGMVVNTHETSEEVAEAQRATLEFILINHPLDCTVCDQAGHCKLQDYYYEYNSKPSRFSETKEHKVKAQPLGPDIMLDGERCIVCTRCVRFCDEVTETSELGVFNRGDKSVIATSPEKELDNPLSGCVVDLCPVGALTHRRWRFNSRIWYSNRTDTVCAGCSTGCNAEVCERDGEIIQVKGRYNEAVSGEWMCNEGRYGFERFQSEKRLTAASVDGQECSLEDALKKASGLKAVEKKAVVFSPMLTLEELWVGVKLAESFGVSSEDIAVQVVRRELSKEEAILVSPDYSPNLRAAEVLGLAQGDGWRESLEERYQQVVKNLAAGAYDGALFVGDFSLLAEETKLVAEKVSQMSCAVAITSRAPVEENAQCWQGLGIAQFCNILLPGRTPNEKRGTYVNKDGLLQRLNPTLQAPFGSFPEWMLLAHLNSEILPGDIRDERSLFKHVCKAEDSFAGITLKAVGSDGFSLFSSQHGSPS